MTKLALVIGYGQSNERGVGVAPRLNGTTTVINSDSANNVRHAGIFGQPNQSLTTTAPYVEPCSIFRKLSEAISLETGRSVQAFNYAKGGTAVTGSTSADSWCGWNSAESRVINQGESGYDPSSYIANMINKIAELKSNGWEIWTFTSGHQADLSLNRPTAEIIKGSVHIQQRAIVAGASKVFVGKTPRYIGGPTESEWNAGGKIHLIADGVLAGVSGSIVGADLSTNTDTKLCATDNAQFIHLNQAGMCWAAEKWMITLRAAGVF